MNDSKTAMQTEATPDDPATLAYLKVLVRQRNNARRALLKRRRKKSGQ